jgi:hypothetical protein
MTLCSGFTGSTKVLHRTIATHTRGTPLCDGFFFRSQTAGLLSLTVAGTAFGAHCINESKPEGAGVQGVVLLDPVTFEATFEGANPGGRLPGGFADVYIDADDSGTLTAADIQVEDDIFLVANHSHKANPAQGEPAILPPILAESDPGGEGHGIGVAH